MARRDVESWEQLVDEELMAGDTIEELLVDFPYLSREDFSAVLRYAADRLDDHTVAAE